MGSLRLVLASSSPRRHELLRRLTHDFAVVPAQIDETPRLGESPAHYVVRLAEEKALAVVGPGCVAVGADTTVVIDGTIVGKPRDRVESRDMLRRLSDREHEVMTGVAVAVRRDDAPPVVTSDVATSVVSIGHLDEPLAAWYVAMGEGDDKAGAYGLQGRGAVFADAVSGSITNVIGLPLPMLVRLLSGTGVLPWEL